MTGHVLEALGGCGIRAAFLGVPDDRFGQRVLGVPFNRRDQRSNLPSIPFVSTSMTFGFGFGQCARLVHHDDLDPGRSLQGDGVLEQHTVLGTSPEPTMIAVGVANPRRPGQVIATTVVANRIAVMNGLPVSSQTAHGLHPRLPFQSRCDEVLLRAPQHPRLQCWTLGTIRVGMHAAHRGAFRDECRPRCPYKVPFSSARRLLRSPLGRKPPRDLRPTARDGSHIPVSQWYGAKRGRRDRTSPASARKR